MHGGCISVKPQTPQTPPPRKTLLPPLPLPILRLLLINKLLHNIMQRIIPPRNKQHIIRCDRRTTCVFREVLEVLGHAFCALVSTAPLYLMGVNVISPVCAHTISVSAPMNCGVAFTPRRSVSADRKSVV